jgi:cobalt-zinc-cadmium efflux system protein
MNHNHDHINNNYQKPIIIGIFFNVTFIIVEVIYGLISNSIALITDAGHNFSDVLSLILAGIAGWMITRKSTSKFTYGFKRGSILIALVNSIILLVALGAITWEAVHRLSVQNVVNGKTVMLVASVGIVVNGITAYMFMKGRDKDLNVKSVFLHMLTDTFVSAGVVVSGILIYYLNLNWIDPVISLAIVLVILYSTWGLLKETIQLTMDAVPSNIEYERVQEYLQGIKGVKSVHDLHIWGLSTSHTALTVHLIMEGGYSDGSFLNDLSSSLHSKFGIEHTTIQIEDIGSEDCLQEDCTE